MSVVFRSDRNYETAKVMFPQNMKENVKISFSEMLIMEKNSDRFVGVDVKLINDV